MMTPTGFLGVAQALSDINEKILETAEELNRRTNHDYETPEKDRALLKRFSELRKAGYDVDASLSVLEDEPLHLALSRAMNEGLTAHEINAAIWRAVVQKDKASEEGGTA